MNAPTSGRQTKAAQREATTRLLIDIARQLFAAEGYAQVSTEEIVQRAGVTRGALYHHFGSKEGLFLAVLDDVLADVAREVAGAAAREVTPWQQVRVGCHAFLRAAAEPAVTRIALVDAPAVLDWECWRELDERHSQSLLRAVLTQLYTTGAIAAPPAAATALLSGSMNEAALWIARAPDREAALAEAIAVLDQLLSGLLVSPPATPPTPD